MYLCTHAAKQRESGAAFTPAAPLPLAPSSFWTDLFDLSHYLFSHTCSFSFPPPPSLFSLSFACLLAACTRINTALQRQMETCKVNIVPLCSCRGDSTVCFLTLLFHSFARACVWRMSPHTLTHFPPVITQSSGGVCFLKYIEDNPGQCERRPLACRLRLPAVLSRLCVCVQMHVCLSAQASMHVCRCLHMCSGLCIYCIYTYTHLRNCNTLQFALLDLKKVLNRTSKCKKKKSEQETNSFEQAIWK